MKSLTVLILLLFIKQLYKRWGFILIPIVFMLLIVFIDVIDPNNRWESIQDTIDIIEFWTIWGVLPTTVLIIISSIKETNMRYKDNLISYIYHNKITLDKKYLQLLNKYQELVFQVEITEKMIDISYLKVELKSITDELTESILKLKLLSIFDTDVNSKFKQLNDTLDQLRKKHKPLKKKIDKILSSSDGDLKLFSNYQNLVNDISMSINELDESIYSFEELHNLKKSREDILNEISTFKENILAIKRSEFTKMVEQQIIKVTDLATSYSDLRKDNQDFIDDIAKYISIDNSYELLIDEMNLYKTNYKAFISKDTFSEINKLVNKLLKKANTIYLIRRDTIAYYEDLYNETKKDFEALKSDNKDILQMIQFNLIDTTEDKKRWILENGNLTYLFKDDNSKYILSFMDDIEVLKIFTEKDAKKMNLFSLEKKENLKWLQFFHSIKGNETKDELIYLIKSINDTREFKNIKNFVLSQKSDLTDDEREIVRKFTSLQ